MSIRDRLGQVEDNKERHRYEIRVGDSVAGFIDYRPREGRTVFTHTEVDPDFNGQGIGSALVAGALDLARADDLLVTPHCSFVQAYIERHEEYQDLVAEAP